MEIDGASGYAAAPFSVVGYGPGGPARTGSATAAETGCNGAAALGTGSAGGRGAKPQTMQYPLSITPSHPGWMHVVIAATPAC